MTATKECVDCKESKILNEFYSQTKSKVSGEEYIYYTPRCKTCTSKKSFVWEKNNPEKILENRRRHDKREKRINQKREVNKNRAESGKVLEWQRNNKDKIKGYRLAREANKKHNIPEEEWKRCKEFFSYRCAYCGLDEIEHKKIYRQQLHKEHVIHTGRNDIKNCVPSCKSCNGSKHTKTLNEWYSESNPNYTYERYMKIYQWIRFDCKNSKK